MRVWRIASAAHAAFDGDGGRRHGSRWTPRGIPAVFTSAPLSLAALERFVHTDSDLEPTDLHAIPVEIRDDIAIDAVDVPSVVIPHERNFMLNPIRRDFTQIVIGRSEPFSFDPRMWKK